MSKIAELPDGRRLEFPDGTPDEVIDRVVKQELASTATATPTKTGVMEDIGIGLESMGQTAIGAGELVKGGVQSLMGDVEGADQTFRDYDMAKKARAAELATKDQGMGGKIISGVAGIAPAFALAAPLGFTGAVGAVAGAGALENTVEDIQQGSKMGPGTAIAKTMADAGLNTAAMALPAGKGLISGAAWGAGGNVAAQGVTDTLGQAVTKDTEGEKRYQFEGEKYGVTAAVGAILGGAVGVAIRKGKASDTPAAEGTDRVARDLTPDDVAKRILPHEQKAFLAESQQLERLRSLPQPENADAAIKLQQAIAISEAKVKEIGDNIKGYEAWLNRDNPEYFDKNPTPKEPEPIKAPTKEEAQPIVSKAVQEALDSVEDTTVPVEAPLKESMTLLEELKNANGDPLKVKDFETRWQETVAKLPKEEQERLASVIQQNGNYGWVTDAQFGEIVKTKSMDEALDYLIGKTDVDAKLAVSGNPTWGMVAQWIKNNKYLRPSIALAEELDPKIVEEAQSRSWAGFYTRTSGRISLLKTNSPEAYLHEIVHAGTARLLDLMQFYRTGQYLTLDATKQQKLLDWVNKVPEDVRKSAQDIHTLYDGINRQILNALPDRGERFARQFEDIHEFVAYGLTDPAFQSFLNRIKLVPRFTEGMDKTNTIVYTGVRKPTNALRAFIDKIQIALGFKTPEAKTALESLIMNSKPIIDVSTGKPLPNWEREAFGLHRLTDTEEFDPIKNKNSIEEVLKSVNLSTEPNMDLNKVRDAVLKAPDSPKYWLSVRAFGKQQVGEMLKHHPMIHQALRALRLAETQKEEFASDYMYGDQKAGDRKRFGTYVSLEKIAKGGSLAHLIKTVKFENWGPVRELMTWAGENRIDHAEALAKHSQHLTPEQKTLYTGLAAAMERARKFENNIMSKFGGKKHDFFPGYHPLVHKGDFEVMSTYMGAPLYREAFRTRFEATEFQKKMQSDSTWGKTKIEFRDKVAEKAALPTAIETQKAVIKDLEEGVQAGQVDSQRLIDARNRLVSMMERGGLGGHALRRIGIPGAEGNKLYRSPKDLDVEFRQSFLDFGDEMGSLIHKKLITRFIDPMVEDPMLSGSRPNQTAVVSFLKDMATNQYHDWQAKVQNGLRDTIDKYVTKAIQLAPWWKDYYPKVHIWDRNVGVATHLFYISTLTTRPGFWAAQMLSSPQSIRQLFKAGTTVDAMKALGKGMVNVFTGGDADFHEAIHWVASNTTTFHPQFINEINAIGLNDYSKLGGTKAAEALRKIIPWATGERQSAAADAVSRYMSFAMFYEHYKSQGKKGEALWKAAALDTDSTMVKYNNPNRAPWIRKMGAVGELVAPLQTFATAQIGNLVADLRYMAKEKTLKSTLPLITTAFTTMAMGGAIGLPFIVEWEAIRKVAIWLDKDNESLWSFTDLLNRDEVMKNRIGGVDLGGPRGAITYGLPSAATGLDIGSGLRWNAIISRALTEDQSLLTMFPAIEFGRQLADAVIIAGVKSDEGLGTDMVSRSKERTAMMKMGSFVVGGKAAVDEAAYDAGSRSMVPGGTRGYAQRPQTEKERISTAFGSSTIEAVHQRNVEKITRRDETLRVEKRQTAIDYLVDGIESGNSFKTHKAIETLTNLGLDSKEIDAQLEAAYDKRNIPARDRFYMDKKGRVKSKEQQRKYEYQRRFYGD